MKTFKQYFTEKYNQKDYKFYVVITGGKDAGKKAVGKIESGWEYKEDAHDQVKEIKSADRITSKVFTAQGLKNKGLNPDNDKDWIQGPMMEASNAKPIVIKDGSWTYTFRVVENKEMPQPRFEMLYAIREGGKRHVKSEWFKSMGDAKKAAQNMVNSSSKFKLDPDEKAK
jgi:hypothetical protein